MTVVELQFSLSFSLSLSNLALNEAGNLERWLCGAMVDKELH